MRFTLVLLVALLSAPKGYAQDKGVVSWTYEVKKTAEKEYNLIFKASILKGAHMYSQYIGDGGPIPTSFSFDKTASYNLVDSVIEKSKAIKEHDKMFDMDLIYYFDSAQFVQHVKITGEKKDISGSLEYMACDGTKCYPPETVKFIFRLP